MLWFSLLRELKAKGLKLVKKNITVSSVEGQNGGGGIQLNKTVKSSNQSEVKAEPNLPSLQDGDVRRVNQALGEMKGKVFSHKLSNGTQLTYGAGFKKDVKLANSFLLNIPLNLKDMNVSRQGSDAKEQKLILEDPVENIMNMHRQDEQIHHNNNQDQVHQDDDQGQPNGFKTRKLNSFEGGKNVIMSDNSGFLPWENQRDFIRLQKVCIAQELELDFYLKERLISAN